MKSLFTLLASFGLILGCTAQAGQLVNLSVVDRETGAILSPVTKDGKQYVIGVPGHRYALRVNNRSRERVLAVLSVDGVNAVSGETANTQQSGYVLEPWGSTEVDGWRKSLDEVADFNFTDLPNSYAARTGRGANVGVIGVAVFREHLVDMRDDKIAATAPGAKRERARDSAASVDAVQPEQPAGSNAPATARAAAEQNGLAKAAPPMPTAAPLGTGHGSRESAPASYAAFERESSQPNEVVSLYYDSYRNLVTRGVIRELRPIAHEPQAFPGSFVPDPAS